VFRGTTGIGVEIRSSFLGQIPLPTPEDACKLTHTLSYTTHYRDPVIDQWETRSIQQVRFKLGTSEVHLYVSIFLQYYCKKLCTHIKYMIWFD